MMQDKFARLGAELEGELVERTEEIRCALLALVAGCTFFMVGPPGVAKSLLARRLMARIADAEFFDACLDRMATPELLFGPWSLSAMRENRWERELQGTLATAHVAHVDEVFAGSAMLLQSLLWAFNERQYRHGTTVIDLPLTTAFCSSNAVPTDPSLAAFWDRLILRRVLPGDLDKAGFVQMLGLVRVDKPEPVLSWAEVLEAQHEAARIPVPESVLEHAWGIHKELGRKHIVVSPRRMVEAMGVVRASAWLDGRSQVEATDLAVLSDILWPFPEQVPEVRNTVEAALEHSMSPAVKLLRDVRRIRAQIVPGLPDAERMALAQELGGKVDRATTELDVLERRRRTETTRQVRKLLALIRNDIAATLFLIEAGP
jgi:MoxR-like ATPase